MFSSNVTGIPQMQMRVSSHVCTLHHIASRLQVVHLYFSQ